MTLRLAIVLTTVAVAALLPARNGQDTPVPVPRSAQEKQVPQEKKAPQEKQVPQEKQEKKAADPNPRIEIKTSLGDVTLELFANEAPKTVANFIGLAEGTKEYTDAKTQKKTKGHFFDGLIFHRVIPKFMAQGGCPLGSGSGDPGYKFEDEINAKDLGLDKMKAWENNRPNPMTGIHSQQQYHAAILRPLFEKLGIKSQKELDDKKVELEKERDKLTVMDALSNMGYKYDDSRPSHRMLRGTIAMANSGPNTNGSQFFINMIDNEYLNGKHTVFGKVLTGMDVVDKMQTVKMKEQDRPETDIKIVSIRKLPDVPPAKGGAGR